jgi:hypothetical protein
MARSPTHPYHNYAPDLSALLPFSETELKVMREQGVKWVEVTLSDEYVTVYTLDERGRVNAQEHFIRKKGRSTLTGTCAYQYNIHGRLLSKKCFDPTGEHHDTLAYDQNNRLSFYASYRTTTTGKRKWRGTHTYWKLTRSASSSANVTMLDSTEHRRALITFNEQNEVVRVEENGRTDSLSVELDTLGLSHHTWWYRKDHPEFRRGQEVISRDGRPLSETLWDMIGDGRQIIHRTHFHYDADGLLYKKENEIRYQQKDLYTHHASGLIMEHLTIYLDRVVVRRYRYGYQ